MSLRYIAAAAITLFLFAAVMILVHDYAKFVRDLYSAREQSHWVTRIIP